MKKFFALILALLMTMSLGTTALAVDNQEQSSEVKITVKQADTIAVTFEWSDLVFAYDHTADENKRWSNEGKGSVTVTKEAATNIAITATAAYEDAEQNDGVSVLLQDDSGNDIAGEAQTVTTSVTVNIVMDGQPSNFAVAQELTIGTVTVTVAPAAV